MLLPKFCITPMLWPRRECSDSLATSDWHTGRNGPSARPMSRRAPNSADERGGEPGQEGAQGESDHAREQDRLAPAGAVRQRATEEGRQRPGEGERRGHESDLLVGEVQVLGDERHQVAGRVAVEEQDAEGDAEHPDQTLFVAHIVLHDPRLRPGNHSTRARRWRACPRQPPPIALSVEPVAFLAAPAPCGYSRAGARTAESRAHGEAVHGSGGVRPAGRRHHPDGLRGARPACGDRALEPARCGSARGSCSSISPATIRSTGASPRRRK